jgi:hypothetical protein
MNRTILESGKKPIITENVNNDIVHYPPKKEEFLIYTNIKKNKRKKFII